jgi:hypothetical protein
VLGNASTPGITLVATSAQNEYSSETEAGGVGTNAILDCIEGRDFVQDSSGALDLVEIGRRISTRLRETTDQNPVVWGLNLYGPPRFCRNPRYSSDMGRPLREVIQAWPTASDSLIRSHYDTLWKAYSSVNETWNPRVFSHAVAPVLEAFAEQPDALLAFFERLAVVVIERAQLSEDAFRPAQVAASMVVCLLPHMHVEAIARSVRQLQAVTGKAAIDAGVSLLHDLERDRFALLARRNGGLSDLFYLPLRIANVLGWSAAATLMFLPGDSRIEEANLIFKRLLSSLLEHYAGSIVAMSEAQASCWTVALSRAIALGMTDEAEQLLGMLFNSLLECNANLARGNIPEDEILGYLRARREGNFASVADSIERPDETTAILLRLAARLGLEEEFDSGLWQIDWHSFMAHLNDDFTQFGTDMMSGGQNLIWTIGDGVYRVSDLMQNWPAIPRPVNEVVSASAVLAALLYPDRVPWFLLEGSTTPASET